MNVQTETTRSVMRLASERPEWIPALRAACACARRAEPYGGEFAGAWVVEELRQFTGQQAWLPGLRALAAHGLVEKSGPSTRGGRRAYYRMPDRPGVEAALEALDRRNPGGLVETLTPDDGPRKPQEK